jgi:hypothetical protein
MTDIVSNSSTTIASNLGFVGSPGFNVTVTGVVGPYSIPSNKYVNWLTLKSSPAPE